MSEPSPQIVDRQSGERRPSVGQRAREELLEELEPVVAEAGYELVEVELASDREGPIVRLYVDTIPPSFPVPEGRTAAEVAVRIEDCTHVSRQVSAYLDRLEEAEASGSEGTSAGSGYRLEVSSPGIFRPLRLERHFVDAVGERVKVRTGSKVNGRRVFIGWLAAVGPNTLEIDVDSDRFSVPLSEVARANLEPLLD